MAWDSQWPFNKYSCCNCFIKCWTPSPAGRLWRGYYCYLWHRSYLQMMVLLEERFNPSVCLGKKQQQIFAPCSSLRADSPLPLFLRLVFPLHRLCVFSFCIHIFIYLPPAVFVVCVDSRGSPQGIQESFLHRHRNLWRILRQRLQGRRCNETVSFPAPNKQKTLQQGKS